MFRKFLFEGIFYLDHQKRTNLDLYKMSATEYMFESLPISTSLSVLPRRPRIPPYLTKGHFVARDKMPFGIL